MEVKRIIFTGLKQPSVWFLTKKDDKLVEPPPPALPVTHRCSQASHRRSSFQCFLGQPHGLLLLQDMSNTPHLWTTGGIFPDPLSWLLSVLGFSGSTLSTAQRSFQNKTEALLLAAVRLSLCLVRFVFFYFCCILFIFCIVFLFARVFLSCRVFELSGPPYPSVLSVIFSFQSLQLVLGDSREQIIQHKLKGSPSSSALFASKQTKVAELTKCFTHKSTTMMTVGSVGEEVAPKARGYNQWGFFPSHSYYWGIMTETVENSSWISLTRWSGQPSRPR